MTSTTTVFSMVDEDTRPSRTLRRLIRLGPVVGSTFGVGAGAVSAVVAAAGSADPWVSTSVSVAVSAASGVTSLIGRCLLGRRCHVGGFRGLDLVLAKQRVHTSHVALHLLQ